MSATAAEDASLTVPDRQGRAASAIGWYESLPQASEVFGSTLRPLDEALAEVLGREPGAVRRDLVQSWNAKRTAA